MRGHGRVLVIGLDTYERKVADALIAEGRLPNFARLASSSACFDLEQELTARYTGETWHQISTGLHPSQSGRWSPVWFDPRAFHVTQPDAVDPPFTVGLSTKAVVFDVPHFNLARDPGARGVVNWGCHHPGVPRATRPGELWSEIEQQFGTYPAGKHIYGLVWDDVEDTERMARDLVEALETRRRICSWLLKERFPDWELALVGISEFHSIIETAWHGWDPSHPLHGAPSSAAARQGMAAIYEAADRLVGDLMDAFPDATIVAFSPHGMGQNLSDPPALILIPELMQRYWLGKAAFAVNGPVNGKIGDWSGWVNGRLSLPNREPRTALDRIPIVRSRRRRRRLQGKALDWMPAARYRFNWRRMKAFAIPAYHDARIRLNVKGRESGGLVRRADYRKTLEEVAEVLRDCVDENGKPLDIEITFTSPDDPLKISGWQTDIVVRFKRTVLGLYHPRSGEIGPVPYRRTGGHTGRYGVAYVKGQGIAKGDRGVFSTYDVVPTIRDLAEHRPPSTALGRAIEAASQAT